MESRYDDLVRELRTAARPERPAPREFELYLDMIVRLADSLGWDVPTFDDFHQRAEAMPAGGYRLD